MGQTLHSDSFYLLRTPTLPIDDLLSLNQTILTGGWDGLALQMRSLFDQELMREAIYLASPELYQEMDKWLKGEKSSADKSHKMLLSLYKYYLRMTSRSTPYGMFAGCSTGVITDAATTILFAEEKQRKHARLDMNYVAELANRITALPIVREQLRFYPNNTHYIIGDQLRYVEYKVRNKNRIYLLSAVKASQYVRTIVEAAREGLSIAGLVTLLVHDEISREQATAFVNQLIDNQILVSELEPTVTGPEFFQVLVDRLRQLTGTQEIIRQLVNVGELLSQQNSDISRYQFIKEVVEQLTSAQSKDLVQIDLYFQAVQNHLNQSVVDTLTQTAGRLMQAGSAVVVNELEDFKRRFSDRWEEQEVPLLLALDNEAGIGYGITGNGNADNLVLLKDLVLPRTVSTSATVTWNDEARLRQVKYEEFCTTGCQAIDLSEADIDSLIRAESKVVFPESMFLFGNLLAASASALDQGTYQFVLGTLFGPSAANLLGRFCNGDKALTTHLQATLQREEANHPDAIYAEIVHLPEARIGNILMRPQLRHYEIAYLGQPSVDDEHCILVNDLLVSVRNGEVILRSKRLNRRIIPRLSTAHNYARGITIYKFLCDLQSQGTSQPFQWHWGVFAKKARLPRITYRQFILSRERWFLQTERFPALAKQGVNVTAFTKELRQIHGLPRWVMLHEGDNELPLDLDCEPARQLLIDKLTKRDVVLYEHLQTPDNCFVAANGSRYTNEIILPLYRTVEKEPTVSAGKLVNLPADQIPRLFMVGSEWLYVKLYCGNKTADRLLAEVIKPLTKTLLAGQRIDSWFFVRYNDPKPHLRIRFHGDPKTGFWSHVLGCLHQHMEAYTAEGLVFRLVVDTYQREVERYGLATMLLSETIFYHDSVAVSDFLDLIEGDSGEQYRWQFALRNVDMLLQAFGFDLPAKHRISSQMAHQFLTEFGGKPELLHRLNDRYRAHKAQIDQILDPDRDTEETKPAVACFQRRSCALTKIATETALSESIGQLIPSFIHMTLNRMFLSKQRLHELVIYHYLSKYYESQMARQKSLARQSLALIA